MRYATKRNQLKPKIHFNLCTLIASSFTLAWSWLHLSWSWSHISWSWFIDRNNPGIIWTALSHIGGSYQSIMPHLLYKYNLRPISITLWKLNTEIHKHTTYRATVKSPPWVYSSPWCANNRTGTTFKTTNHGFVPFLDCCLCVFKVCQNNCPKYCERLI